MAEDQVFVAAFLRSHGSIKEMEQVFGVELPTVKARLNRIAAALEFVDLDPQPPRTEVIERLKRGEITADDSDRPPGATKMTQSCEPISAPRSNQLIVRSPDRSTKPTRFRLWLPLTPLLLLLSPLLLLALVMAAFAASLWREPHAGRHRRRPHLAGAARHPCRNPESRRLDPHQHLLGERP